MVASLQRFKILFLQRFSKVSLNAAMIDIIQSCNNFFLSLSIEIKVEFIEACLVNTSVSVVFRQSMLPKVAFFIYFILFHFLVKVNRRQFFPQ